MRELLTTLARALVDAPEGVEVTEVREEDGWLHELMVDPEDRGKVIGKRGTTADALRVLLDAVARRRGTHCDVEILD